MYFCSLVFWFECFPIPPPPLRNDRRDFIKAKYEQHKFAIITCSDKEDLKQDLKQAILYADLPALLQVYAEGLDLSTPLPDMVSILAVYNRELGSKYVNTCFFLDWVCVA